MPRLSPDHVAQRIRSLVETSAPYSGDHPDERGLHQILAGQPSSAPHVDDALELYLHAEDRHVVNALILAKASNAQIADALGMSLHLTSAFRHLFFDRDVFRHDLDVKNYVRALDIPDNYRLYYTTACEKGFRTLANLFHVGERPPVDPKEALRELLADQLDRARAHRGQRLDSELAREALRWSQAAGSTANILLRQDPQDGKNALEELKLALRVEDQTTSLDQLDIGPGHLYH